MDQTAFLIGFSVMSVASLAIYVTGKKTQPSGHHTLLHASVPFIAATAYLAMAFGIGTLVNSDLDSRVVGIDPVTFRAIPRRIGMAGGARKHDAIRAAVLGGWVNVLVTDVGTAQALLA